MEWKRAASVQMSDLDRCERDGGPAAPAPRLPRYASHHVSAACLHLTWTGRDPAHVRCGGAGRRLLQLAIVVALQLASATSH